MTPDPRWVDITSRVRSIDGHPLTSGVMVELNNNHWRFDPTEWLCPDANPMPRFRLFRWLP